MIAPHTTITMDTLEAIRGRRAIRDYADEPLDRTVIGEVIADAVWAPSGMNRQPWRFVVVEGREALARCSARAKVLMLQEADRRAELAPARSMLAQPSFNMFYNAPAMIIVCASEADEMALKDCCLAAQTLMLAAFARGLGTCWIGFAELWLDSAEAKVILGMPEGLRPIAPIIIGRPIGQLHTPSRNAPHISYVEPGG